jgi:hypothetical protein
MKERREFSIEAGKEDSYYLISKKLKSGKIDKYKVDLRNFYCECKGFWFRHNCTHIKTIIELLKAKGIGIVWNKNTQSYYTNWDYQDIEKRLKNES